MPSFAKKANPADSNPLAGLWKDHPNTSPLDDLLTDARVRAAEILRDEIPGKITHIRNLIAQEDDPSSLLYKGHVESGDYLVPRRVQPDTIPRLVEASVGLQGRGLNPEDIRPGEDIVLPDDVVVPKKPVTTQGPTPDRSGVSTPGSERSEDTLIGDHVKLANGLAGLSIDPLEKGATPGPHWFEVVPRNKIQTDLAQMMIAEHEELNRLMADLRLWLELEIPVIEDGNSFGAEVQNHLIKEIDMAYKRANGFANTMRQHHIDRIKTLTDWLRYPNVMDYPAAIASSDRLDHFLTRSYLRQMLTIYGGLMTKFQKNWEKVVNPKGNGGAATGGMY